MTQADTNVVLAADDKFARALAAAARSVVANLSAGRSLDIYILDMGMLPANKRAIASSLEHPGVRTIWIESARDAVAGLPTMAWFTTAAYARLLIPELLPETVERAVYLDSDVIVRRCIGELHDADVGGLLALAVPDMGAPFVPCAYGLGLWFDSGRSAGDFNFNTGVMVMNLHAWREERISQQAMDYLRSDRYQLNVDQEALNAVAGTRIGAIDPRWNMQGEIYEKHFAIALPYPREFVQQVMKDPWIIHYSTGVKPWMYNSWHPWRAEWIKYLDQTAYKGWRPPVRHLHKFAHGMRATLGKLGRRLNLK